MTVRDRDEDELVTTVRDLMARLDKTQRTWLEAATRKVLLDLHAKLIAFLGEGR